MADSAPVASATEDASSAKAATDALAALSEAWATLTLDGRKARYGVAYVRSICAQAGVPCHENMPDEDVLAVDCDIKIAGVTVTAQVKCTSTLTIRGRSISWPVKTEWVKKWQDAWLPVYFILVIVPADSADWIDHDRVKGTFHRTAAYWRRIRPDQQIGTRISIPKEQRLQVATLDLWYADLLETFNAIGGRP
jgi:hypothetical protein